ncbi:MAG TPA: TIM-barrel domain-containing protein [Pseudonocardiaceae bacterium]|nr:TIM-barrel domain-containing protein [Pseudonocardiaceae bacterium]
MTGARFTLMAAVLALGLSAAPAIGAPAPASAPGVVGWHADPAPFRLTYTSGGRTVTGEAAGSIAGPGGSLAYQTGTGYHRLTNLITSQAIPAGMSYTVGTDEPGRTATVAVTHTSQGLRVHWSFTPDAGVDAVFEALTAGPAEHYLGGSSAASVDLRGHVRGWSPGKEGNEAGDDCQNQEQSATPFYLSSGGYGFYADTDHIGRFAFPGATQVADGPTCGRTPSVPAGDATPLPCPVAATAQPDRVQICLRDDQLDYDVFVGSPQQVTAGYYRTVGLPSLPPPTEFGLTKWRDVSADEAQVLSDVDEFRQLGIPLSTIFIDNPWEQQPPGNTVRKNGSACTGSLRFDPTFFPDPQAMIDQIHADGVKFGLWLGSQASTPNASQGGGSCAGINDVWAKNNWLIPGTNYLDFSNPAARQYYVSQLTKLVSMGVDMTKEDRAEEYRLQTATLAGGSGASLYLRYPDLYQSAVTQALRAVHGNDFETLVRAGTPWTAHDTHGMWGSDTYQTFAGLRAMVDYGISESLSGGPAWGSDTGGIDPKSPATATNSPTPTLFTRWAQFSSISPVFEVGGAGLNATPWQYPAGTVDDFRDSAILHYELFPYFYALAEQAASTGVPILRALGYQYPDDQRAWAASSELMVGPDLLAAPVSADSAEADGEAGRPTDVSVYLPAGDWIDLFTGTIVHGGQTISRSTDLSEFPLYLRAGSAIGFDERAGIWPDSWSGNELSKPGLAGWLVAPGANGGIAISSDAGRLDVTKAGLRLTGAPPQAQILVLAQHAPTRITMNGHPLPEARSVAVLSAQPTGWTFTSGPFGGILLKLRPDHGAAQLTITASPANPS